MRVGVKGKKGKNTDPEAKRRNLRIPSRLLILTNKQMTNTFHRTQWCLNQRSLRKSSVWNALGGEETSSPHRIQTLPTHGAFRSPWGDTVPSDSHPHPSLPPSPKKTCFPQTVRRIRGKDPHNSSLLTLLTLRKTHPENYRMAYLLSRDCPQSGEESQ